MTPLIHSTGSLIYFPQVDGIEPQSSTVAVIFLRTLFLKRCLCVSVVVVVVVMMSLLFFVLDETKDKFPLVDNK